MSFVNKENPLIGSFQNGVEFFGCREEQEPLKEAAIHIQRLKRCVMNFEEFQKCVEALLKLIELQRRGVFGDLYWKVISLKTTDILRGESKFLDLGVLTEAKKLIHTECQEQFVNYLTWLLGRLSKSGGSDVLAEALGIYKELSGEKNNSELVQAAEKRIKGLGVLNAPKQPQIPILEQKTGVVKLVDFQKTKPTGTQNFGQDTELAAA